MKSPCRQVNTIYEPNARRVDAVSENKTVGVMWRVPASLLALMVLLAHSVIAHADYTSSELLADCRSDQPTNQSVCSTYLQGFVDGAIATDPRVAENVAGDIEAMSEEMNDFMQSIVKSRIGDKLKQYGPSYYANICIPGNSSTDVLRTLVRDQKPSDEIPPRLARDWLYDLLLANFPCSE